MNISDILSIQNLQNYIKDGFISCREHNSGDYLIYNYTAKTQYERFWNNTTTVCRGLITDTEGNIISRPFKKFFNLSEISGLDIYLGKPYTISEKADGCLGILWYDHNGNPNIATRGSFHSDQAEWATDFYRSRYSQEKCSDGITRLFEIICKSSKIVINYDFEDLIHITSIDNNSGNDVIDEWNHRKVRKFNIDEKVPPRKLQQYLMRAGYLHDDGNQEGVVLTFDTNPTFRLKIKLDKYVEIHKFISNLSCKSVWGACYNNKIQELIDLCPDELYNDLRDIYIYLSNRFMSLENHIREIFHKINCESRKEFAARALQYSFSDVLFKMKDGQNYDQNIWKKLKPDPKSS